MFPDVNFPPMLFSVNVNDKVEFGLTKIWPSFPRFSVAVLFAGVSITAPEKKVLPDSAFSPLTVTDGFDPSTIAPEMMISPES